jgi:hypothetical protein
MKPGPNLLEVTTRRDHDWLVRWIQEPDVMLAEKDPIATELFETYNKLPMPNLRVSEKEVDMLLDFIETETRRMKKVMAVEAIAAQQNIEEMDCCQKNEEMVITSDSTSDDISQTDEEEDLPAATENTETLSVGTEDKDTEADRMAQVESTTHPSNLPRPFSLFSWACGLGLCILAFRARMAPKA